MSSAHREAVRIARSVVVKVGTTALTAPNGMFDAGRLATLADAIEARMKAGSDVVIVSSGAIAAGIEPLGLSRRPTDLATKQAAASVGQVALVNGWSSAFHRYGRTVGQVLLTAHDISMRVQHTNAQRTLDRLRSLHAVAIVNENDTVATNEIRFGDNDRLAALVAHLVHADLLVLLSDVDGLYDGPPAALGSRLVAEVALADDLAGVRVGKAGSAGIGTGGMRTKLDAARIATGAGTPVVLTSAARAGEALAGEPVGTWFHAATRRRPTRQLWLAHATEPKGVLLLDEGAVRAVTERRASLLAAGLIGSTGSFSAGDPVDLAGPDGAAVARGLVNFDADEIPSLVGKTSAVLRRELGAAYEREVVHRDDLVLLQGRG